MVNLRQVPLSGDKLTDWVFKQFVFFLRKETLHIKRKKRLLSRGKKLVRLSGLMESGLAPSGLGHQIIISTSKKQNENRDKELETLIHELSHILFWKTRERFIGQIEEILIKKFTKEQKDFLKSFIPRHEVKS